MRKLKPDYVDVSILSETEIEAIKREAAKQVETERKKVVIKQYHEQLLQEERAKFDGNEVKESVLIDLPGYTTYVLINGVYYHHGSVITVPRHIAMSIREIIQNAWIHERQSGNPNLKDYKTISADTFSAKPSYSRA